MWKTFEYACFLRARERSSRKRLGTGTVLNCARV